MKNVIYITADNGTLTRGALLCAKIYKLDFIAKTKRFFFKKQSFRIVEKINHFFFKLADFLKRFLYMYLNI